MFLLNSRPPFVTATCPSRDRHPFYRSYGANLPNSLARCVPTRLGLLTQGHLCRFWVRSPGVPFPPPLFTGSGDQPNPPFGRPFPPSSGSLHYGTPRTRVVRWSDGSTRPTPKRRGGGLRCRRYPGGSGMLTGSPFGCAWLRTPLGPANPRLTTIA